MGRAGPHSDKSPIKYSPLISCPHCSSSEFVKIKWAPYDKPEEHILNIIVQGSDNKILLIEIVFNEGKCKTVWM